MRVINASILAELASGSFKPFVVLHFNLESTDYYYTECDVPIVTGGNAYQPRGMEVGNVSYSAARIVDQAQISIDDVDQVLKGDFIGGTPQNMVVTVGLVALDSDNKVVVEVVTCFQGYLGEWAWTEGKIVFTVTHKINRWNQHTLNKHASSCRWEFKGTECAYAGVATWCDRSYGRCSYLENQDNFGGFRWLPSIERKDVWWGRTRA